MHSSPNSSQILWALVALIIFNLSALAADPGLELQSTSEANDEKPGAVLFFNTYTSDAANPKDENTRINITNISSTSGAIVHLFFINGETCLVAESYICLTQNQTASFLASDVDPDTKGYIIAVAVDSEGKTCPEKFSNLPWSAAADDATANCLIGDAYVKFASGHAANLPAISIAQVYKRDLPVDGIADNNAEGCGSGTLNFSSTDTSADIKFDGLKFNRLPRALALSNIPSPSGGNNTLLIINRVGGDLRTGAAAIGSLFGLVYDDAENPSGFTFRSERCQFISSLSDSFPRTAPRLNTLIPAGRSGWMKIFSQSDIAIIGAVINFNANAGAKANAFNGGHNLHHLTLSATASITIPVYPPNCSSN